MADIDDTALNSIQSTNQLRNELCSLRKETKRFTLYIYLIVFIYLFIFPAETTTLLENLQESKNLSKYEKSEFTLIQFD